MAMSISTSSSGQLEFSWGDRLLLAILYLDFSGTILGLTWILWRAPTPINVVAGAGIGACIAQIIISRICLVMLTRSFHNYNRQMQVFKLERKAWTRA